MEGKLFGFLIFILLSLNLSSNGIVNCDKANKIKEFISELAKDTPSDNDIEESLENWEPPVQMKKELVYYLSGYDEEDRPIWVAEWGKWDVKKYTGTSKELLNNYEKYLRQMELRVWKSIEERSTPENPVVEFVLIIDAEGYSLEQIASGALLYNIRKFASWTNLIGGIGKAFILNTNFLAERVINLAKPILGNFFNKFEIYGSNPAKWIPKFLKQIPRSQVPQWYGGTKDFKPVAIYG